MTDERKAIEQALQAAAMELKAKGAAADPEAEAPAEQLPAAPEAAPEETPKAEAPEASDAEMEKAPAEEKQPEQKTKADSKRPLRMHLRRSPGCAETRSSASLPRYSP